MLVLFDNGTPRTLARYLIDHHTITEAVQEVGKSFRMETCWPAQKPRALRCS